MKKINLFLIFWLMLKTVSAQLTIIIDAVPNYYMPLWDDVYVAGNFNTWNPGDNAYKFIKQNNKWQITFSPAAGALQFKFTRGNWVMVETQTNGSQLPNRTYTYNGGVDTVHCTIAGWDDFQPGTHTITQNVFVLDGNLLMPQLQNRTRRVWIYLPDDYYTSAKDYRVLYLQDGQNIFDASTSFAGEWGVDDTLHAYELAGDTATIVVAIDNGGTSRLNEYCPYINPTYGGGEGDAYTDFLVQTLKPAIDSAFRTKQGREYTAVAGSSMGAYISLFAALKYQNVFSKVGSFSPAYWFDDSLYTYVLQQGMQMPLRIYQVCSQNEGASVVTNQARMQDSLITAGFSGSEILTVVRNYGGHNEAFWRKEFGTGYQWLFAATTPTPVFNLKENKERLDVFPNPCNSFIHVKIKEWKKASIKYVVYDVNGKTALSDTAISSKRKNTFTINTKVLLPGTYFLKVEGEGDNLLVRRFLKR